MSYNLKIFFDATFDFFFVCKLNEHYDWDNFENLVVFWYWPTKIPWTRCNAEKKKDFVLIKYPFYALRCEKKDFVLIKYSFLRFTLSDMNFSKNDF